jgi:hypothetical protein
VHDPLLSRAAVAGRENQGRLVVWSTALDIDALPAYADDGAIGYAPVLTRSTIAGYVQDGGTLVSRAALHIETKCSYADNVSIVEGPLLVLPWVTSRGSCIAVRTSIREGRGTGFN